MTDIEIEHVAMKLWEENRAKYPNNNMVPWSSLFSFMKDEYRDKAREALSNSSVAK